MRNVPKSWIAAGLIAAGFIAVTGAPGLASPVIATPKDIAALSNRDHNPDGSVARPASAWSMLKDAKGAFQVLLPGRADKFDRPSTAGGHKLTSHYFGYHEEKVGYLVSYSDLPPMGAITFQTAMKNPDFRNAFLDVALHGAAKSGKMISDREVTFLGTPGREIHVRLAETHVETVARYGFAGNRLYMAMVIERGGDAPPADMARFFSSFHVSAALLPRPVLKPEVAKTANVHGAAGVPVAGSPGVPPAAITTPAVGTVPAAAPSTAPPAAVAAPGVGSAAPAAPAVVVAVRPVPKKPWAWFRPSGGGFGVRAPGVPEHHVLSVNSESGRLRYQQYLAREGATTFEAGYVDYGKSELADGNVALAAARDRFVHESLGRVTDTEDVSASGKQGVQFRVELPGSQEALVRLFLVGNRLYQLGVITPTEESYSDASMSFLNSFHLK